MQRRKICKFNNLSQKGLMTGIGALSALPLLFGQGMKKKSLIRTEDQILI